MPNFVDKIIQAEIRKQDLIKTGNMLRSIKSKVTIKNSNEIDIDVSAVDYFIYVNGNFDVTEKAFNSPAFRKVIADFNQIMVERSLKRGR